jgi:hypothetical protein
VIVRQTTHSRCKWDPLLHERYVRWPTLPQACNRCRRKQGCYRQIYDDGRKVEPNIILTDHPSYGCSLENFECDFVGLRLPCEHCKKIHTESECVRDPKNSHDIYLELKHARCTRYETTHYRCKISPGRLVLWLSHLRHIELWRVGKRRPTRVSMTCHGMRH